MEFTKEQLIRRAHLTVSRGARELENHPDRDGVAADIKIASIAARALMAEPIYQLWDEGYFDTEKEIYVAALKAGGRGRIVYPAPPAPECLTRPVHPRISSEELDDETLDELIDFRRCTFEYHSQQDNKVQTIIHGVTLTAMLELRERRAAMLQGADNELQRKAEIHDALCAKNSVESLADFVDWQRNHIAELEAAPPAPVGPGETAVMPDYPGYVMTQRECYQAGKKAGLAEAGNSPMAPDGWKLVPVEPTAEMLQSGISAHYERNQIQIHDRPAPGPMECAYVAMLAAAPQQEVK